MELVRFTDATGREWEVWEVGGRPPRADGVEATPPATRVPERWLCFASGTERRRLLSYPLRWYALPPPALDALCRAATPARHVPMPAPPPRPNA